MISRRYLLKPWRAPPAEVDSWWFIAVSLSCLVVVGSLFAVAGLLHYGLGLGPEPDTTAAMAVVALFLAVNSFGVATLAHARLQDQEAASDA